MNSLRSSLLDLLWYPPQLRPSHLCSLRAQHRVWGSQGAAGCQRQQTISSAANPGAGKPAVSILAQVRADLSRASIPSSTCSFIMPVHPSPSLDCPCTVTSSLLLIASRTCHILGSAFAYSSRNLLLHIKLLPKSEALNNSIVSYHTILSDIWAVLGWLASTGPLGGI